jgi:hypothetical protein
MFLRVMPGSGVAVQPPERVREPLGLRDAAERMVAVATMRIEVAATAARCSRSRRRRRFLPSQAKLRSIARRQGSG